MIEEKITCAYQILLDADAQFLADLEYLQKAGRTSQRAAILHGISITDACLKMRGTGLEPVVIQDTFEVTVWHPVPGVDRIYKRDSLSSKPCRIEVSPKYRVELDRIRELTRLDSDSDAIRYAIGCSAIIARKLQSYSGTTKLGFAPPGERGGYTVDTLYDKTLTNSFRKAKVRVCDWLGKQWDSATGNNNNKPSPPPAKSCKPD